jgi:hypothetical protein
MTRINFNYEHPCFGRNCTQCETCRYDEPIPDKPPVKVLAQYIAPTCNKCGYLIKKYRDKETLLFNATCGKYLIQTGGTDRNRIIAYNVSPHVGIEIPDWCPKIADKNTPKPTQLALPTPSQSSASLEYDQYVKKRKELEALPSVIDWKTIKAGDICVVPRILRQKRRILLVKERTEYVLKCIELDDNFNPTSTYTNIYSNDIDVKFIVKHHKF